MCQSAARSANRNLDPFNLNFNEIVLDVGTGHGILYQPLDAWVLPAVEWANE